MKLSEAEVKELQKKYYYLLDALASDNDAPIDPLAFVDPTGDNLLHIAAKLGDLRSIELLLKAGMDVNKAGDMGYTALHYAKMKKKEDVFNFLLEHGASRNIRSEFGSLPDDE